LIFTESLKIIRKVEELFDNVPNHAVQIIKNKMKYVLNNNYNIKIILIIAEILDETETSKDYLPAELTADDCVYFKHAPVDVERSFSTYKHVLSDKKNCILI